MNGKQALPIDTLTVCPTSATTQTLKNLLFVPRIT